ncbi:hypothetical protein Taro_032832 [Colocasia esculenta]|uniref:Uncharacterized protein n=1 Tax=Colocasia esculenta TaxID=4460 RepID=A0A843W306_COLES|nr:hypothetical protein [Colocasia esculenta]
MFTRLEDLPRARVVWESTAQTNFRKSMWEARDKAAMTTGSQDPTAWMDYPPETYDRAMPNPYVEGTPQPDLDLEAWVDARGGPSVWLWGQPGYFSSVVLKCEFGRSFGLREFICCDAR